MAIKLGNLDISSFKVGTGDCSVYLGTVKLYPSDTPTGMKWLATYDGGTVSSAACDATSSIASGEVETTSLVSLEVGDCVTSIAQAAFRNCGSLTSVSLSDSVTTINNAVFNGCTALTTCTFGSGLTSIGNSVFTSGTSLTAIDIPSGVTNIGSNCFRYCSSLTSVTVNATTPPTLGNRAFDDTTCTIYVPSGSVDTYKAASGWSTYASSIQAIT